MTSSTGTFVIAWSQTEIDGLGGAPVDALQAGTSWSWTGEAVCVDGSNDILVLRGHEGQADLRRRAARAAHRVLRRAAVDVAEMSLDLEEDARIEREFTVTDGRRVFRLALIDTPQVARPLVMMAGDIPPRGAELWVVSPPSELPTRMLRPDRHVICFTKGTRLLTPRGYRPVEMLRPGDAITTRDDGPQEILWLGGRHLSGARLAAAPGLRPIRLRAGAIGDGVPDGDLLVSPRHRILVRGRAAQDLFNTPEVLVAARDLLNDRSITVDHALRSVDYVHILLSRHQVVFANGIASESFHPADACLEMLSPGDRAVLEDRIPGITTRPLIYGAPARRALSRPEAAILLQGGAGVH